MGEPKETDSFHVARDGLTLSRVFSVQVKSEFSGVRAFLLQADETGQQIMG